MRLKNSLQIKLQRGGYYSYLEESVVRVFRLINISGSAYHAMSFAEPFHAASKLDVKFLAALRPSCWHIPCSLLNFLLFEDLHYLGSKPLAPSDLAGYRAYLSAIEVPETKIENDIETTIHHSMLEAAEYELRLANGQEVEILRLSAPVVAGTQITLNQGHVVHLKKIYQSQTYGTLIEGFPDAEFNNRVIQKTLEQARELYGVDAHLLEPNRVEDKEVMQHADWARCWGIIPEYLPQIACHALFASHTCDNSGMLAVTEAAVVWFQESFAMPMDIRSLGQMKEFDWNGKAARIDLD
jgi:hypothetical protein